MGSLTAEEMKVLSNFCNAFVTCKEMSEDIKQEKRRLTKEKKEYAEHLQQYFLNQGITCVPVSVNGSRCYLHLMKEYGYRQIGQKTIRKALSLLDKDVIQEVASGSTDSMSVANVLSQAIIKCINQVCKYTKQKIAFSPSKERKRKRGSLVHQLPAEVKKVASRLHSCETQLVDLRKRSRANNANLNALTIVDPKQGNTGEQ